VKILVGNATSKIVGTAPNGAVAFFRKSYKTMTQQRTKSGKFYPEEVTKYVNVWNPQEKTFPTGLLYQFDDYLRAVFKVEAEIIDKRISPSLQPLPIHLKYTPYDYQEESKRLALEYGRGVAVITTGGGKTFIAINIIKDIGRKTLFLVQNIDLLNQAYEDFRDTFGAERVGIIGNSKFEPRFITVATVQTLWSRFNTSEVKEFLDSIDLLIADEVHHVSLSSSKRKKSKRYPNRPPETYPGNSLYQVLQATNAYWRFGFSATIGNPSTIKRWLLESTIGRPFIEIPYSVLRDKGVLADVQVLVLRTPKLPKYHGYQHAYKHNIQSNTWVAQMAARVAHWLSLRGMSSMLMVNRIHKTEWRADKEGKEPCKVLTKGHAHLIYKWVSEACPDAVLVTGHTPTKVRSRIKRQFIAKEVLVGVGTLFKEGVDIPNLDCTVYLGGDRAQTSDNVGTDSKAPIQAVGRVLRNPGGKENQKRALHIDILYTDGGVLEKHSMERIAAYREYGYSVMEVTEDNIFDYMHAFTGGEIAN